MPDLDFQIHAPALSGGYAYCLGWVDDKNVYHSPRHPSGQLRSTVPLMGDCPPAGAQLGNSRNHGGGGQNILFHDGHLKFLKTRLLSGDDFYLNKDNEIAAGRDRADNVLGPSAAKP